MRNILGAVAALTILAAAGSSAEEARPRPRSHNRAKVMRMSATAYCDRGPTKSGVPAQHGVVAADLRHLPIGTRLQVVAPGKTYAGVYTVLDTGSKIKGRDLDIFMPSCSRARRFGKRMVQVRVLP
jgi:3D (Asp-Asp-Asp) domain-containing protein